MTVTIGFNPQTTIGPGLPFTLSSSLGSVPSGAHWQVGLFQAASPFNPFFAVAPINTNLSVTAHFQTNDAPGTSFPVLIPTEGSSVSVQALYLNGSGTVQDSGSATATWDPQAGIGTQIELLRQQGVQAILSPTDSNRIKSASDNSFTDLSNWDALNSVTLPSLGDVINNVLAGVTATIGAGVSAIPVTLGNLFSGKTLDTLTEADMGTVCFPDVFTGTIPIGGSAYGLMVENTTIPEFYAFTGPAGDYSQQVLCTLQLQRGGDTVLWSGVHTLTHMVYPLPGVPDFPVVLINLPIDPGDYTVTVTPNTGVCTTVKLLGVP